MANQEPPPRWLMLLGEYGESMLAWYSGRVSVKDHRHPDDVHEELEAVIEADHAAVAMLKSALERLASDDYMTLTGPTIGPLFNMGWAEAVKAVKHEARTVLAALDAAPQEEQ